jgi:hypothetical protein
LHCLRDKFPKNIFLLFHAQNASNCSNNQKRCCHSVDSSSSSSSSCVPFGFSRADAEAGGESATGEASSSLALPLVGGGSWSEKAPGWREGAEVGSAMIFDLFC